MFAWLTAGLVVVLVVAGLVAAGVRPILHRLPERVVVMIREAWRALRAWGSSPRLIAEYVTLGLAFQVLTVLTLVLVARTVGVELPFPLAAVSAAIVLVAMLIPISVGGLGVREGGFVLVLAQADIGAAQATSISLLYAGAITLGGGTLFLLAMGIESVRGRRATPASVPNDPSATPERV